jgi:hypothetical protein
VPDHDKETGRSVTLTTTLADFDFAFRMGTAAPGAIPLMGRKSPAYIADFLPYSFWYVSSRFVWAWGAKPAASRTPPMSAITFSISAAESNRVQTTSEPARFFMEDPL